MSRPLKLTVCASHPIQYQVPLFRALALRPEIDLTVLFYSTMGLRSYTDAGFGREVSWDVPLLGGYRSIFLQRDLDGRPRDPVRSLALSALPYLSRERSDAILIHGWAWLSNWLAVASSATTGVPLLLRGESTGLRERQGPPALARSAVLRALFRRVAAFLAIGTLNAQFYRQHGIPDNKIFLAPYSVDNAYFQERSHEWARHRAALRTQLGIHPNQTVFLFCGKLIGIKRPMDLLTAFARLPRAENHLIFVGDGDLRPTLEDHAARLANVTFAGFQNQSELPRWYTLADVLVLPSDFEPWGLVVNEAMNAGLPVIASDQVGAVPDLVQPGETGLVFPAGDVHTLSATMLSLSKRPALRACMSRAVIRRIDQWGISDTIQGILGALDYAVH